MQDAAVGEGARYWSWELSQGQVRVGLVECSHTPGTLEITLWGESAEAQRQRHGAVLPAPAEHHSKREAPGLAASAGAVCVRRRIKA
ncbi:hypothetical protein GCM10011247_16230 [Pseudomonas plecoglossicida]|nr:hypothetical protein GCM10011247_16230 [Pseudomonas plecoglossicida]